MDGGILGWRGHARMGGHWDGRGHWDVYGAHGGSGGTGMEGHPRTGGILGWAGGILGLGAGHSGAGEGTGRHRDWGGGAYRGETARGRCRDWEHWDGDSRDSGVGAPLPSPPGCSPITGMSPPCPPPLPIPGFPSTLRGQKPTRGPHRDLPVPKSYPPHTTGPRSPWARYSSKSMAASAASSSGPTRPFPGPRPRCEPRGPVLCTGRPPAARLIWAPPRQGGAPATFTTRSGMFGVDFMGWERADGQEVHGEPAWPRRACVLLGCPSGGGTGTMRPPRPAWCHPSCSFPRFWGR